MAVPIIQASDLSKKFVISHQQTSNQHSLRETITQSISGLMKGSKREKTQDTSREEFYALKDLNFEISAGDRVGIIGRNGAGKSTLLKILSRITEPSSGRIVINGRVASLLEVGTGFHPELSGRENIYLNGAILGMSRQEIKAKFDEIVDFSEVEKFLDTPVKRYSSGMYVRLAFAVAAHLEPEILVVDEVLAVGDAQFQKKCLGKLADVSENQGRTVLFVSHNIAAIKALCTKGILLASGELLKEGGILEVIEKYNGLLEERAEIVDFIQLVGSGESYINIRVITINGKTQNPIVITGDDSIIEIKIEFELSRPERVNLEFRILDSFNQALAFFSPGHSEGFTSLFPPGRHQLNRKFKIPPGINRGKYHADLSLTNTGVAHHIQLEKLVDFEFEGTPTATGHIFDYENGTGWLLLPPL